jgi:hypothetical protein
MVQVTLQVPYSGGQSGVKVSIQCDTALVQVALTCLAYRARLTVCDPLDPEAVLITDSATLAQGPAPTIWVRINPSSAPPPRQKPSSTGRSMSISSSTWCSLSPWANRWR